METEETTKDIMKRHGVSLTTVRRWMKQGMPSHTRTVGLKTQRRFVPELVDAWLRQQALERRRA